MTKVVDMKKKHTKKRRNKWYETTNYHTSLIKDQSK